MFPIGWQSSPSGGKVASVYGTLKACPSKWTKIRHRITSILYSIQNIITQTVAQLTQQWSDTDVEHLLQMSQLNTVVSLRDYYSKNFKNRSTQWQKPNSHYQVHSIHRSCTVYFEAHRGCKFDFTSAHAWNSIACVLELPTV